MATVAAAEPRAPLPATPYPAILSETRTVSRQALVSDRGSRSPSRDRRSPGHNDAVLRRPALLVIDELSYLPVPGEAASALFQVVAQRYMKTSIVITTKRRPRGGEVLDDTTVAAATLDRLLYGSVVLNLDGNAY